MRDSIIYDRHEWSLEDREPQEQRALTEAMRIQRWAEVIELTGWDFYTLLAQPRDLLDEMLTYQSIKHAVQEEKRDQDKQRSKSSTGAH